PPGGGAARLPLSKPDPPSTPAAATALRLEVSVNPLKLNVAEVEGTLTLAETACETPEAPAAPAADGVRPQGARAERAAPAA
ncbi:hypothetical protein AB8O53_36360, partial [Streptomyces pilosus]